MTVTLNIIELYGLTASYAAVGVLYGCLLGELWKR